MKHRHKDKNRFSKNRQVFEEACKEALQRALPSILRDGEVDYEALFALLGPDSAAGVPELVWEGKREAMLASGVEATGRLQYVPEESKNSDATEHLYIEGDNLEALRLLRQDYTGRIKMIYIDPPYNTGHTFTYQDKFKTSTDEHSEWLNMIAPRLILGRELLSDQGVIWISIDDHEADRLKLLCDEIFGEEQFIGRFVINATPNARDYGHIGKMHEYALFYAKDMTRAVTRRLPDEDKSFKYSDETGGFNIHPLYNSNVAFHKENRPNLYYPFYLDPSRVTEDGFYPIGLESQSGLIEIYPPFSQKEQVPFVWRWGKDKSRELLNREIIGYRTENGDYRIVQKMRHKEKVIRSLQLDKRFTSRRGTAELEHLFGCKLFSFPKPLELITMFCGAGSDEDAIVLDFFSGSATTAHAVMRLNAEDGGRRRFIMVQRPEPCEIGSEAYKAGYTSICEIGKERIRLAGERLKEECLDPELKAKLDVGFKVFRITPTS
jgi:adenine-specific DNA-methyltransferase